MTIWFQWKHYNIRLQGLDIIETYTNSIVNKYFYMIEKRIGTIFSLNNRMFIYMVWHEKTLQQGTQIVSMHICPRVILSEEDIHKHNEFIRKSRFRIIISTLDSWYTPSRIFSLVCLQNIYFPIVFEYITKWMLHMYRPGEVFYYFISNIVLFRSSLGLLHAQ